MKLRNNDDLHSLEIEGNDLEEGEDYELQLNGYLTDEIKSSQKHTFTTNESPSGGTCDVDKKEGIVLTTNFTFTCFDWKDKDDELIYQFGYTTSASAFEILQEGPQSFLHTNKLPLGYSKKDSLVQVDIYVKDQWGGYARESVEVKVRKDNSLF